MDNHPNTSRPTLSPEPYSPSYLDLSHLTLNSTLNDLPTHQFQITPTTLGNIIAQEFEKRPHLPGVIVMEDSEFLGAISRRRFIEHIGRPYGIEVYLKRPINILFQQVKIDNLQLDSNCTIEAAAQAALNRSPKSVYEPLVVEFPARQHEARRSDYFAIGGKAQKEFRLLNIYVLLLAQSHLLGLANSTIQSRAKELEELNANKDKLFSIISHDLKSPFAPLIGLCELLPFMVEQKNYDQALEAGEAILRSAKNVFNLLENLLDWATMQRDSTTFEPQALDLYNIVEQNITLLQEKAAEKSLQLLNKLETHPTVYADEHLLDTVVRNLISNALKFTHSGGEITILADQQNHQVVVSVVDTGVGIPPEKIPTLFDVGENRSTNGTAKERGTGLGLILCKEMVEKNGGQIWVKSQVDVGSTFTFTIPTIV